MVKAQCGHEVEFELFEDKKDKYRENRRKKITDQACKECREKANAERTRIQMEEARARREAEGKPCRRGQGWKSEADAHTRRLPNGSSFSVTWDAFRQTWSGSLTVVSVSPPLVFSASAGGVFRLLQQLDRLFREWLGKQNVEETKGAEGDAPETK
jgi:hypothetical protein